MNHVYIAGTGMTQFGRHLDLLMCSPVSEGAAALVLANEEGLAQ